jgi:hypothetical protein
MAIRTAIERNGLARLAVSPAPQSKEILMAQAPNTVPPSDNSGMGVVLGILIAVLLVVGGFFFLRAQGVIEPGTSTATNIEAPDVTINTTEPAAGTEAAPAPANTAPAQ